MRKIVLLNQKGGCGKTTTAVNLAAGLARKSRSVLLMDLDPQGHVAVGLGVKPEELEKTTYEVLTGRVTLKEAVQPVKENFDALFSNVVLSAFEQVMSGAPERESKLSLALKEVEGDYDYLIIDSPPGVGLLTFNALMAATEVIIPVDASFFSLHGLGRLLDTVNVVREKAGHELTVKILATNIDRRTNFGNEVVEELRTYFPKECFLTVINTSTKLREAVSRGVPIIEYDRRSTGCRNYQDLVGEILQKESGTVSAAVTGKIPSESEKTTASAGKETEVMFAVEASEAEKVQIAGDFNNWIPEDFDLTGTAEKRLWQKIIPLKPGRYQYKYIVDGNWIPDPGNEKTTADSYGGINSVVSV